ncbi:MAG: hypothetical protein LBO73_02675, partial [Holosporaceae bacterium]|nr:hypothetical protein [Holosporaceae bacterium]
TENTRSFSLSKTRKTPAGTEACVRGGGFRKEAVFCPGAGCYGGCGRDFSASHSEIIRKEDSRFLGNESEIRPSGSPLEFIDGKIKSRPEDMHFMHYRF